MDLGSHLHHELLVNLFHKILLEIMSELNIFLSFLYYNIYLVVHLAYEIGMISFELLSLCFYLDKKSLKIISFPLIQYTLNEYELKSSNNLLILVVAGSALLLIMCVKAKWSTIASKSTFFNK